MTKFTMRDVARLAGVSVSTVSAVINSAVPVSVERVKRVQRAMEALDYHPDQVARSLKLGKTHAVGVIVPDLTNVFYPQVIRGVEEAAREGGYAVLLCDSNDSAAEEQRHLATLLSRRVDGILLACCIDSTAYQTMAHRRIPIVFFDCIPLSATANTVSTDNAQAAFMAAQHLIELGHRRIAILAGELSLSSHVGRLEGFRKAMQKSRLPVIDDYLRQSGVQIESGYQSARELLCLAERPTAIIATNNKLALGLLQAVNELRIECPKQLSIVGIDDDVWSNHLTPRLTTIAHPTYDMGRKSLRMLETIMGCSNEKQHIERQLQLRAELRIRDSTAPPQTTSKSEERLRRAKPRAQRAG